VIFQKPKNLDGAKLRAELRAAQIEISDEPKAVSLTDNDLDLEILEKDFEAAKIVVAAHKGES
jgi:hypothetical protein